MEHGPWAWIMIVLFLNGMLTLFAVIGAFSGYAGDAGDPETWEWSIADPDKMDSWSNVNIVLNIIGLSGFSGIGTIAVALFTFAGSRLAGVSPYLSMAYTLVVTLYVNTFFKVTKILSAITSSLGAYSMIMVVIGAMTMIAFAMLVVKTLKDMSAPTP